MSHRSLEELTMALANEDKDFGILWRDKIEEWLQEEGWTVGHETIPGTRWVLQARDNRGRPVIIGNPAQTKDLIVIQQGIALETAMQQQIGQLEPRDRRGLLFDLHEAMILVGVQYDGIGEPLRQFVLVSNCYLDGLTKTELLGRITRVRDAGVLASDKIARALDQPPRSRCCSCGHIALLQNTHWNA